MATKSFSGGDKLEAKLRELSRKVAKAATVTVGWQNGQTYPDGTLVSMVAAIQEFGAPRVGIPPRPFFRPMIAAESPKWGAMVEHALKLYDYDAARSLGLVGHDIAGALSQSIGNVYSPALSPVTLMLRKMFGGDHYGITFKDVLEARARVKAGEQGATGTQAKPLVWTGQLMNAGEGGSITAVVT